MFFTLTQKINKNKSDILCLPSYFMLK